MKDLGLWLMVAASLCISSSAFAYQVNNQEFTTDAFFADAGKTGPVVTTDARNVPFKDFVAEVAKQSGVTVTFRGFDDEAPAITIQAKEAPVLHVFAEIAKANGLDFSRHSGDKTLEIGPKDHGVLAYAVKGPVLVTWHGRVKSSDFDFSKDVPTPVEITKYQMRFTRDLGATLETHDPRGGAMHKNQPVRFKLADGTERTLQSDHDATVFGGPWPDWRFEPVPEFAGKTAEVSVKFPVSIQAEGNVSQKEIEFVLKDCPV